MHRIWSRSLFVCAAAMVLVAVDHFDTDVIAQSAPPRPNVSITKYPTLVSNIWPADFNRDGRTDIVAGRTVDNDGQLIVRLGLGNGTFGPERNVAFMYSPVTVGDFNGDSRIDIIALGPDDFPVKGLYILGGNGDGTFRPAQRITGNLTVESAVNGIAADFNGDGKRDFAMVAEMDDRVWIFPGNGDLTFGPETTYPTGPFSRQFIVAQLNGDTLPDIAVTTQYGRNVDLFLNQGGLLFTHSSIQFDHAALGITAWDMNGDSRSDLIVATGEEFFQGQTFSSGEVNVLLGQGNGTFAAPMTFVTGNGPVTAVAGDFNGDGVVDVATGNISEVYDGVCDGYAGLPDSISILPGLGGGRLGSPVTVALAVQDGDLQQRAYRMTHHALKTSDFNGDRRTDLIASPGALLMNRAAAANRAPTAFAGDDREFVDPNPGPGGNLLWGRGTDPDNHWLTFEWRDEAGNVRGRLPRSCFYEAYHGRQTFTLTVRDGFGGVASDTVDFFFGLPAGWDSHDIGAVSAAGSGGYSGNSAFIRASGADIWGTADEFHIVDTTMSGDYEFTALVTNIENVNQWTKVGLMVRESTSPSSRHASIFATPTAVKGVAFQRRPTNGGTSVSTAGPAVGPPVWLRLRREGNIVRAFARVSDTDAWTLVGSQTFTALPASVRVGFAATSHVDGTLADANFENVTLAPIGASAFQSNDIGAVGAAGSSSTNLTTHTVTGSGADVWGTADELHYFSRTIAGDFDFSARVTSVENVNAWTKAGLMIREGLAANARHAFVISTPTTAKGLAFQRRTTTGGTSVHTAGPAVLPPRWLRLTRVGNVVTAYQRSSGGDPWTAIGSQTFSSLAATVRIGFAVSSHVDGTLATATFDNVTITP
jgi:hypothetical protein